MSNLSKRIDNLEGQQPTGENGPKTWKEFVEWAKDGKEIPGWKEFIEGVKSEVKPKQTA